MRLLELTLEWDSVEGCEAHAEPHRTAALAKATAAARAVGWWHWCLVTGAGPFYPTLYPL